MIDRGRYRGRIRVNVLDSLIRYAETGCPTGGFLEAVLSNDLMGAARAADPDNRKCLVEIALFVLWELPKDCHGSPEAYRAWVEAGAARLERPA